MLLLHNLYGPGSKLDQFATDYIMFQLENGHFPLTYHPQYFVCRKTL